MSARDRRGMLLCALWAGMPLYPAFIALVPIAPPGLSLIPRFAALAIMAAVGLATAALAIELRRAGGTIFGDVLGRPALLWLAAVMVAGLCGLSPLIALVYGLIGLCTVVGVAAVRRFGVEPGVMRAMGYALAGSSLAGSLAALACWLLRRPSMLYAVGNGRAIGTFVVPGELAGYLGMLLPYLIGTALTTTDMRLRRLCMISGVIGGAAAVASFSRAGLAGLAIALLFALVANGQRRRAMTVLGLLVVVGFAAVGMLDARHNPAEDFNRPSIWTAALQVITLFPLTGVGPGGFGLIYPLVRLPGGEPTAFHAHDFLLTVWAETGVIGLIALANLWLRFVGAFRARFKHAAPHARTAGLAVAAGFVATWAQSTLDVVQVLVLGLWIPFMGMALNALEGNYA